MIVAVAFLDDSASFVSVGVVTILASTFNDVAGLAEALVAGPNPSAHTSRSDAAVADGVRNRLVLSAITRDI